MFEQLEEWGIHIPEHLRYYPYHATFDFEAFFHLLDPSEQTKFQRLATHDILSVSINSNVP